MVVAILSSLRLVRPRAAAAQVGTGAGRRMAGALLLALALLLSQFLGLLHGIAHAGWPPAIEQAAQASFNAALFNYIDDEPAETHAKLQLHQGSHHHHSCVDYDAASGASGIHVNFFSPPLIPGARLLALWQAFASWDAPVVCHFSSRAPPR